MDPNPDNPLYDVKGRLKRIVLASQSRLEAVEYLAGRFFREVVLDPLYEDCLLTDESDLCDFVGFSDDWRDEIEAILDRFEAHYFVDARLLGTTNIVQLLELLRDRGVAS